MKKGLYQPYTFSIMYKGFCFSGIHSIEIDDEYLPIVVTIERLYIDDSDRDILTIVDPAIVHWLEKEIANN